MGWPRPTATALQWHGLAASQAKRPGGPNPSLAPKRARHGDCRPVAVPAARRLVLGLLLEEAAQGMAGGSVSRGGPKRAATRRSAALGFGRRWSG
jgi:hypothetical protein